MYRHTQIGTALIIIIGIIIAIIGGISYEDGFDSFAVFRGAILLAVLIGFSSLTVEVKEDSLVCWFGPGLIRRTIDLSRIQEAKAVRNPWYSGWGIRLLPSGWLWNVSGLDAVELIFRNGKRFRIGTNEPERLIQVLKENIASE